MVGSSINPVHSGISSTIHLVGINYAFSVNYDAKLGIETRNNKSLNIQTEKNSSSFLTLNNLTMKSLVSACNI